MRNMTEGSVCRHLLAYAVPLIFGNMLQLTYNAVDAILVSKGAGLRAYSAVSVCAPVSILIVQGVSGIGIGASVYISKFFGANDFRKLKRCFSTTILFCSLLSLFIMLFGTGLSGSLLRIMNVPPEILTDASMYLRFLFLGNVFTFQYNILSNALRAIGDAKTPVYFVAISSVLNGILDYILIFPLRMGVFGAAVATLVSQLLSSLLCYLYVYLKTPLLSLRRGEWVWDWRLLRGILGSGFITALQQTCQPIGKVLIQSVINLQGTVIITAFDIGMRIDDFGRIPTQTISNAIMTSVAQNRGAKKEARMLESFRKGLMLQLGYAPLILLFTLTFRRPLVQLFAPGNGGEEMIRIAAGYLMFKSLGIFWPAITNTIQGYFRGINQMGITLLSTFIQIFIRTVLVYLIVPRIGINGEALATVLGLSCMMIFEYGYFFFFYYPKRKRQLGLP